jgi:hypothetical protein
MRVNKVWCVVCVKSYTFTSNGSSYKLPCKHYGGKEEKGVSVSDKNVLVINKIDALVNKYEQAITTMKQLREAIVSEEIGN